MKKTAKFNLKDWAVLRVKKETLAKFNYQRAKAVTPEDPIYKTQEEFMNILLDRKA